MPGVALRTTFIVGLPGRDRRPTSTSCEQFVSDVEFDHVGVFTYSHEEGTRGLRRWTTTCRARVEDAPPQRADGLQKRIVRRAQQRRASGERVRVLVDGPSPEHGLVLRGRLAGQAPDIDSCVYLTDCDPETCRPGDFVDGDIVGARDYDLVVRPLPAARSRVIY